MRLERENRDGFELVWLHRRHFPQDSNVVDFTSRFGVPPSSFSFKRVLPFAFSAPRYSTDDAARFWLNGTVRRTQVLWNGARGSGRGGPAGFVAGSNEATPAVSTGEEVTLCVRRMRSLLKSRAIRPCLQHLPPGQQPCKQATLQGQQRRRFLPSGGIPARH